MNKLLIGAALALSLAIPATAPAQRPPAAVVVVVDTDRIYRDCNACRIAQTQLQALGTQLQQRAQQLGQPIQTEMQSIQQAATAARNAQGAARATAEAQIQQRLQALQRNETTANEELQRLQANLRSTQAHVLQQINARLNPVINQVMTQRQANLAVDVGATLAHSSQLNVTDAVLASLNQQLQSVVVSPMPQQAAPAGQPTQPQPPGR
ncbi:OmpH family outer membrane protein [Allosphingosinicella sp.]|jgi:Skp family chaperone for outer membrane proteins|uniref:OmpH family outer membrane protein n=1 Tax=Allosphingosinicella sp. TaxID=2823234 RepID=UPI002EF8767E